MAHDERETIGVEPNWYETMITALDIGCLAPFSLEWLIDRAERGERSGLWW